MPHIIVEHSPNIEFKNSVNDLTKELHLTLAQQETIKLSAIKTRVLSGENYIIGDGSKTQFLFLKLLLLPGRSPELRMQFAEALLAVIEKYVDSQKCTYSVEVSEMLVYASDK